MEYNGKQESAFSVAWRIPVLASGDFFSTIETLGESDNTT